MCKCNLSKSVKYGCRRCRCSNSGKSRVFLKKFKMVEYIDNKIYGINNIDCEKLSASSEFPIGSVTKLIIIISLLILHQQNKINIHDNIGLYIENDHIGSLIILDIINHTSGLKNMWPGVIFGDNTIKYNSATEIYERWNSNDLIDDNMKGLFQYSNIGYHLLGVIIEKVSGMIYSDFVKKHISIPLRMTNTGSDDTNITLYNGQSKKLSNTEKLERSFASSSGELKSCIKDLIEFSKFTTLLDNQTLNLLRETWVYSERGDIVRIYHNGSITGGQSDLQIFYDTAYTFRGIQISLKTIH